MNTPENKKRSYSPPSMERVRLDNEVSLVLQSAPPFGPGENISSSSLYYSNDPFKTVIG